MVYEDFMLNRGGGTGGDWFSAYTSATREGYTGGAGAFLEEYDNQRYSSCYNGTMSFTYYTTSYEKYVEPGCSLPGITARQTRHDVTINPSQKGVVGDIWNSINNNLNSADFAIAGLEYSGSRALSRTMSYTNSTSIIKPIKTLLKLPGYNLYPSTNFIRGATKVLKVGGFVTGFVGASMTIAEISTGQKSLIGEGGLDLIMGGVAFIPGGGWMVTGAYFGGKALMEYTGNDFWNK